MNDQDRTLGNYLETGRDPDRAFHVVALHDGPNAEMRVNRALAWLHESFRDDLRMVFNSWSLRDLDTKLESRSVSIRTGGSADLIIIANSDSEPLPDQFRGWLDDTLSQQRDHRSLIVALENDHSHPTHSAGRLCAHVERVATSSGASHLCCEDLSSNP